MELAAVSKVVEGLYAAAIGDEPWLLPLESIARLLEVGDGHVTLLGGDPSNPAEAVGARIHETDLARLVYSFTEADGAPHFGRIPANTLVNRRAVVSDEQLISSEYYNEVVRPLNGFYSVHFRGGVTAGCFALSICRPHVSEDFSSTDLALINVLIPHLANAIAIGRRFRRSDGRAGLLERVLDRVGTGVIISDRAARMIAANAEGERILSEADGLTVEPAGLAASTPQATLLLRSSIVAVSIASVGSHLGAAVVDASPARRLSLCRPSRRLPLQVTLTSIERNGDSVALFVTEPDAAIRIDRSAIADAFGLTHREAQIASLIGEGLDLAATARLLSLGVGTVRNHLKRVFEKTGVHSQAALVALARAFAPTA